MGKKKKRRSQLPRIGKEFISDPDARHPDKIEQRTLTPKELAQLWVRRDTVNLQDVEQYIYAQKFCSTTYFGIKNDIKWHPARYCLGWTS